MTLNTQRSTSAQKPQLDIVTSKCNLLLPPLVAEDGSVSVADRLSKQLVFGGWSEHRRTWSRCKGFLISFHSPCCISAVSHFNRHRMFTSRKQREKPLFWVQILLTNFLLFVCWLMGTVKVAVCVNLCAIKAVSLCIFLLIQRLDALVTNFLGECKISSYLSSYQYLVIENEKNSHSQVCALLQVK